MVIKCDLNCNIGCIRQNNEDIILLGDELFRDKAQASNFETGENARFAAIVADGMGGHNGGEIASEYAVTFFCDFVLDLDSGLRADEVTERLKDWTKIAH